MAYTDGLMIFGSELSAVQVETAAADLKDYVIPCNITILQAGVLVTEDFTEHTINPIFTVQKKPGIGGTAVPLVSVTLASGATSSLKRGDGVKEAQTAPTLDVDIDDDDVILAYPGSFPITVKSGEVITLKASVASGSAGGAYVPFIIARIDGVVDGRQDNVWTATVSETA